MKNFAKLFGIIAIAAVIGFSVTACGGGGGGGGSPGNRSNPVDPTIPNNPGASGITYTAASDNTTNTYAINFIFSGSVPGLTIDDITVTNGTGAVCMKNCTVTICLIRWPLRLLKPEI